jgi:hypothetical protein
MTLKTKQDRSRAIGFSNPNRKPELYLDFLMKKAGSLRKASPAQCY